MSICSKAMYRSFSVFFWIAAIFLFLFAPNFFKYFKTEKSVSIFTFPKLIDAKAFRAFEEETGAKVYVNYYESNDELLVKMRQTKGQGYDIILPSDYTVEHLIKDGLLKRLDKSKLPFLHIIDSRFLGHYFDPENNYSIPYLWEVSGIGINKRFFKGKLPQATWKLIFDKQVTPGRVGMINNPREAILLTAFYLFGTIDNLTPDQMKQIKQLLIDQKKWVEVYTDLRADYLLSSGTAPVVAGLGGDIWQASRYDENLDFLVPQEGTFMLIDSVAISAESKNDELVYALINYLYRPEIMTHHFNEYSLFPVSNKVKMSQKERETINNILHALKKLEFFRNVLTEEQLDDLWVELKSSIDI